MYGTNFQKEFEFPTCTRSNKDAFCSVRLTNEMILYVEKCEYKILLLNTDASLQKNNIV
jgi:hypothetical protein